MVAVGFVLGGLAFSGWVWFLREPARVDPAAGSSAGSSTTGSTEPTTIPPEGTVQRLERASYERGDCVDWEQGRVGSSETMVVDCGDEHRLQVAGSIRLDDFEGRRDYPDEEQWDALFEQRCGPVVAEVLGGTLDPFGRWAVGGIRPTADGWADGDRTVWCGAISSAEEPGAAGGQSRFRGVVDLARQVDPRPRGQCLTLRPDRRLTPVDCAGPHQLEVAGQGSVAADAYPGDGAVQAACEAVALAYLGDVVAGYGAADFDDRSWATGRRTFDCVVGQPGDVFGWGTRTGSLRGP